MTFPGDIHLCYCLNNLDASESDLENPRFIGMIDAVRRLAGASETAKFAVGLWINEAMLTRLEKPGAIEKLRDALDEKNLYVFTFNIFPYGAFHGEKIKEKVYLPDWRSEERLSYTRRAASILSKILPEKMEGSLSSCPGAYNLPPLGKDDIRIIEKNLAKAARFLKNTFLETGKKIMLAIEPEPDCVWEDAAEFAEFFSGRLSEAPECRERLGVCYDCSHHELTGKAVGESLSTVEKLGLRISKIQLSAALGAPSAVSKEALAKFADDTYLHQTRIFSGNHELVSKYPDLPDALRSADRKTPWRIHYHVPIYLDNLPDGLRAEKSELEHVLSLLKNNQLPCNHVEIETYTFPVLPEELKNSSIEESMSREYRFILSKMKRSDR